MKKNYFFKSLAIAGALLAGGAAHAQLVDCNTFLQGQYVELGVMPNGAYGSTVDAPAGYHNNVTQNFFTTCGGTTSATSATVNTLGFVADPDMDGWDAGSPAYVGDYYMPGYPQEGWALEVGGVEVTAYASDWEMGNGFGDGYIPTAGSSIITGTNTSYTNTGGVMTGKWEGIWIRNTSPYTIDTTTSTVDTTITYYWWADSVTLDSATYDTTIAVYHFDTTYTGTHYDSIGITQTTTLDTGSLYFLTSVTFTNLATSPSSDIYYLRTLDPDNDEPESSDFATVNNIDMSSGYPVVTATGTVYASAFIALGSADATAVPFINSYSLYPYDYIDALYAETGTSSFYTGGNTADVGIGLSFHIGSLPGSTTTGDSTGGKMTGNNSKTISYFYAFRQDNVDSAIHASHTTTGIQTVAQLSNNIHVSPNPARTQINVTGLNNTDQVVLYDMMGRTYSLPGNSGTGSFSMQGIPAGAYVLDVFDANGNIRAKLPVQKL